MSFPTPPSFLVFLLLLPPLVFPSPTLLSPHLDSLCLCNFTSGKSGLSDLLLSGSLPPVLASGAWHTLGNVAAIEGDLLTAAQLHGRGKQAEGKTLPPLAVRYQEGGWCNEVGDIFWVSSFAKYNVFQITGGEGGTWGEGAGGGGYRERMAEALEGMDEAARLKIIDVHVSLGSQLEDSGLVGYARSHFASALHFGGGEDLKFKMVLTVPVVYEGKDHLERTRREMEENVEALLLSPPSLSTLSQLSYPGTFYLIYQGYSDADLMRSIREAYDLSVSNIDRTPPSLPPPPPGGRVKVGFVSSYFRRHSVCKLFCGMISGLDDTVLDVTVFGTSKDGTDGFTDEFLTSLGEGKEYVDVGKRGLLLANIGEAGDRDLDVLVYLDVGMDSGSSMWGFSRLARVQVSMWGHPSTTGFKYMDYFITGDRYEPDGGYERFTEQLVRLEGKSFEFPAPLWMDEALSTPYVPKTPSHELPEGEFALVPQSLQKFHPDFDGVIRGILSGGYDVVAIYDKKKPMWMQSLRRRLVQGLGEGGGDGGGRVGEVRFIPGVDRYDFARIVKSSAVVVDPFPFGGGVTTLEAIYACRAVVTCGECQGNVPRLAEGMVGDEGIGMGRELVAGDGEELVEMVLGLMRDGERRRKVEGEICERRGELYGRGGGEEIKEWQDWLERVGREARGDGSEP
ncbi:hypothetical protein TrCOL_g2854 [Triparma columacea]|uniref:O-GlcNAc transferase C-terminal domain-containing protein n=1 Tax=Triparma columacea TaxID=722753 RepID=A0A9W7GH72_9STRA|nr:hypothetical protein TrCOL_g2854 [Triparma columacea]